MPKSVGFFYTFIVNMKEVGVTTMKFTEEQYYQGIKNHLLGTSIVEVYYEVLNSYDELDTYEDWELSDYIHSVEMNIIFKLDNGKLIQLFWDNTFHCYNVGIEVLLNFVERETIRLINVSENDNFLKLTRNKIIDVVIYWNEIEVSDLVESNGFFVAKQKECKRVPVVWQIKFENNIDIWIATFEITNIHELYYGADHLTIFFNEEDVRKYKLNLENGISINKMIK